MTRRGLANAIAASITAPSFQALASMAKSPDRDLIESCRALVGIHAEIEQLMDCRRTIADERRTEPQLRQLSARQTAAEAAVVDGPTTLAGAKAMAQAIVCRWPYVEHGGNYARNVDDWLVVSVAEFLAELPV